MSDIIDDVETIIDRIENGETLSEDRMKKCADDLLNEKSSNCACRVFLALSEKKVFISDLVYERLCNIIINNHEQLTKENSIRTIDLLIKNGRKASDLCLNALSIALQGEQSLKLRRYASKLLYTIIQQQNDLRLNSSLLNTMSDALDDPSDIVQSYTLNSFEQLVRNQQNEISQKTIHCMELILSNIYQDINNNYGKCGLINSFFLNLLYRKYKINENLLEIFSELLVIEVIDQKDMLLNRSALYILQKAIENQLFDGRLTSKTLNNISTCFNLMSSNNKEMLEYSLKILCALNDDQLKLTRLNANLLKHYLKDTNLEESLRAYVTILLGNLCKIPYQYIDDDSSISIVDDTIDILIERLDYEKLLQSSIYALKNIAQYEHDYLSIFPLRKFVVILNRDNINKEIRQNACLIIALAIQNKQILTQYEIDGLENALNDVDSIVCVTALVAFQYFFELYHKMNDAYFSMIKSCVQNISTFSTELLLSSDEILSLNAAKLLEIIIKYNLKTEFTHDEISNLCIGLQTNLNKSIDQYIFESLNQIIVKQSDVPLNARNLIELEKIAQNILQQENFNKFDYDEFEKKLSAYINDTDFDNKIISMNVFKVFDTILKTNSYSSKLILILLQYVQNSQKLSIYLIETLMAQLCNNENIEKIEILIQILYYVIQNGQSLTDKMVQQFKEFFLVNQCCSKYTIQIFQLLINRNEIQIDRKIYEKFVCLLEDQKDYDMQRNLIETLAYSLQNLSINEELPSQQISTLIEIYFQSNSSTREIKYFSCVALNALIAHRTTLSNSTLDHLRKIYLQDDEFDDAQTMTSYSSTINLRDISLSILEQYLPMCKACGNKVYICKIEQIIKQEMLAQEILENRNGKSRLEAGQQLLSIVQDEEGSVSMHNMRILELSFDLNDSSIEYKLIVVKIFECLAAYLNTSQIRFILGSISDNALSNVIINILKALIRLQKSFPIEALYILIDFISENNNQTLRDRVIDSLEMIAKYEKISPDIFKRIQFEIFSKHLRDPTMNVENKKLAINNCLQFIRDGYKLSINTIESLEYLLKNSFNMKDIEEETLQLMKLAVRNGQKLPPIFLNLLSRLTNDSRFNKGILIEIIKLLSNDTQALITQEILDNSEHELLDNLTESYEIFLKGAQNGCKLTKTTINRFEEILQSQDKIIRNQRLDIMKILKNLAINKQTLEEDVIECLEKTMKGDGETMHKSILNILKYLPTYKPSTEFLIYLQDILERHPLYLQIENILNKSINLPIQVKLHIIHAFLVAEYIETDIDEKPLKLICRELLCGDLLSRIYQHNKYDKMNQFEFYANLNALENFFGFQSYSLDRDEILIFFIENHSNFTLKNINEILLLMKTNSEALLLLLFPSNDWLKKLQIHWIHTIVKKYQHIKLNESIIMTDDHAEKIANLLMTKLEFSVSLSECFLQRFNHIEDFNHLILFLDYLYEKNIYKELNLSDYFTRIDAQKIITKDINSWILDIQCDLISKKFLDLYKLRQCIKTDILQNIQSAIMLTCLNGWSLEVFEEFIDILKTKQDEPFELMMDNFLSTLAVINNYNLQYGISDKSGNRVESIFKLKNTKDWPLKMHQFAISVSFDRDEHEKNLKDLLNEMKSCNNIKDSKELNDSIESLEEKYHKIISTYSCDSQFYSIGKPINHWDENDIKTWATYYKENSKKASEKSIYEVICVIKRAIFLHNTKQQFEPRAIQILSLLLMLHASNANISRLAQIKTGEGKSVIIAMFAAIKALNGHKVDIVTTSPLLAKRDAENKEKFYTMLNLTVGENSGTSTVKSCYKNDIVYGNVNEFQFDILKDEYSLLGTRCQRKFDIAIVDEVDSMLIDDNSKICRLSSKIPAIDELKVILAVVWQELNRTHDRLARIDGKLYCVTAPFRMDENGEIILLKPATADDDGNITDTSAVAGDSNIDENDFIEVEDPYEFIENHIKNYVENKLLTPNDKNECLLNIPKHLTGFVKQQLTKWILNAWQAKFAYRENIDYLITDGKDGIKSIVPIDYRNTGIIQTNTSWPDGLHQFLQIKHKLRISAESLTTNFLSNVAFFSRYGKNLFGLTGTLGSKEAKDLIHYIYNVDFVIIPPYKYTQFVAYPDRLSQSEQEWLNECTRSIYNEAKINQRAVLVICETKSDASKIQEKLIEKDIQLKKTIKLYTRSDNEEQNAIDNELDCGQIIVATNLAGRGTDLGTTHKVEENGGLHVLVTFLPLNTRVEHQAFGRTSRQGKHGTAQLTALTPIDSKIQYDSIDQLKQDRDEREKLYIARAKHTELKNIERRDRLFGKFCTLRQKLRQQENDTYKLDSVEELWGLWLKITFAKDDSMNDATDDLNDELLDKKFEEFSSRILADYSSNAIFQNPFYLILKGNEYIFQKKNYDDAIDFLRDAIKSDPIFAVSARYNLAYALIKKSSDKTTEAKVELEEALKTIDNILIPQQETMLISFRITQSHTSGTQDMMGATSNTDTKSDAEDQIMNRINLLCLCKNQIEQGKSVIEDAADKKHDVRMEYKALDEFFSDVNKPTLDINEFKENGFLGFFQLTRKEPTPWLSIIAVGLLGIAQAVAGAALIAFTGGAAVQIGTMLLSEGIGDMIHAIKSAITGEFSWKEYAIQKAISIAITIATCGMAALKETGQAIKSGFKGCATMVKAAAVGGKQLVGQFTKEGWKLVGKQIGQAFLKAGAKEILKTVLDKTILAELSKKINQEISEHIQQQVTEEVNGNQTIKDFLTVDSGLHRNNMCHNEIENMTNRMLHPQSNRFADAAISIAKGIANQLTNGTSGYALQIVTAGKCLLELTTFLKNFFIEFRRDLDKLKDHLKIDHLLHLNKPNDIDKRTAKEITETLKKEHYVGHDSIKVMKPLEPTVFKLDKHTIHETYVINVCNNIYTETTKQSEYGFEKNRIAKTLTDQLANYMTNRLNAELINPAVHTGVDAAVNHLSKRIEVAYVDSEGTLEKQLKSRRAQNDVIRRGKDVWERAAKERAKGIQKDNTQQDAPTHPDIENLAQKIENGAPGDLKDIMALSAKLGRPVQIFRNGAYDMTIGDMNAGEPMKLDFGEGHTGHIGHYTGTNDVTGITPTGANDCLFDTLSVQTNISSSELRQMAAAGIRENSDIYLKMMPSVHFLGEHSNKNLLYVGGDNAELVKVRKHSADDILSDPYLPSKEKLEKDLQKCLELSKQYKPESENDSPEIKGKLILETLIHDITDENIKETIAHDKNLRNIFYSSLNGRLAEFKKENAQLFSNLSMDSSSVPIVSTFNELAGYWKNEAHPGLDKNLFYSQGSVNANFSSCSSAAATDFLPGPVKEMIASQPVDTAGKKAIETFGPAVCPVQFFSYQHKLVATDNRMTLAHHLAGVKPLRLIPTRPTHEELGRMNNKGMPSTKSPKYDKNA
ncbi:unnamed protein product [Rotaria socialis]